MVAVGILGTSGRWAVPRVGAGEDFGADIKVQGLANQAHGQAKKRGMKVRTQVSERGLVIQFVKAE